MEPDASSRRTSWTASPDAPQALATPETSHDRRKKNANNPPCKKASESLQHFQTVPENEK